MTSQTQTRTRALLALAFGHFTVDIQANSLAMLLPLLRASLGLDYHQSATIIGVQYLTSSVIQPLLGIAADRRPIRQILPAACLLAGVGVGTALLMPSYALVLAVVFVTGLGAAAYHSVGSLNANFLSGEGKATGMSYFFAAGQLGSAVGPLVLLALMGLFGPRGALATLAPGILGASVLIAYLSHFAGPVEWQARRARLRAAQRPGGPTQRKVAFGLATIVSVIVLRSVVQMALVTFIPLYFAYLDPSKQQYAGFLLSVFVFSGALGTLMGGPLADRFGRKPLLVGSMALVLPALYLFLNTTGFVQVASLAVAGAMLISAASLTVVMAQDLLPGNVGLAAGLTLGLGLGAGGLGAMLLGNVADARGLPFTMSLISILPVLAILMSLLVPGRVRRHQAQTG